MSTVEPEPRPSTEARMRRAIGPLLGVFVVINATIGTGIFKTPAQAARLAGSLPAALAVWVAGGVLALCGALSLAELAAALPRTGGLYEYLRRAYGPTAAFLLGWTKLVVLIPSAVGSFAKLAAEALAALLDLPPDARRDTRVAAVFVLACTVANLAGVRTSARAQAVITAAKYAGVALLALLGLCLTPHVPAVPVSTPIALPYHASPTVLGCAAALVAVMWAYDGWADLAALAGEVRDPARTLPRALAAGTLAIVVVYLAANLGYARVLGLDGLRRASTGADMAAARLAVLTLGSAGRRVLAALVLTSCVGGCLSSLLTGPRVFVPMATDGLAPAWLGTVSAHNGVPARAVLVCGVLGAGYVSVRSFEQLTEAFVVGFYPFYLLGVAAVVVLRRREPDLARPFRVPGYPVVPALFVLGAAGLLCGALATADRATFGAFGVVALGAPLRWMLARTRTR